jgi:alanine racemase
VAFGHDIELTFGDLDFAVAAANAAAESGSKTKTKLHLKIDTGMRRFGAFPVDALQLARYVASNPHLCLRGIATHFAQADEADVRPTWDQSARLNEVLDQLRLNDIFPNYVHSANSAAMLRSRAYDRDMVRLGIGLYGLDPSARIKVLPKMRPAMTLLSRVRRVFELAAGDAVSYGATYRISSSEKAALIPIGYADGYRREFSNRAWMSIDDARCTVRGRVCMDQTVVGVPDSAFVRLGDTITVAGAGFDDTGPTFDQLAELAGTINYEIVAGIDRRVPRMYIKSGRVVAMEDLNGFRDVPLEPAKMT